MKLLIHARTLRDESSSPVITGHFDERGGTIGRSETNTLALPDPERHVSRLQAEVVFAGQGFSIRNVGSANPIQVNGRSLNPGEGAPLRPGDELVIGAYAMRVDLEEQGFVTEGQGSGVRARSVIQASAGDVRTDPPVVKPVAARAARAELSAPPLAGADPFADLAPGGATMTGDDPFADLMAPVAPAPSLRRPPAASPPAVPAAAARSTDESDPFADLSDQPSARPRSDGFSEMLAAPSPAKLVAKAGSGPSLESDLDDLLGATGSAAGSGSAPSSLDAMFGIGGQGSGDLLDDFLAPGAGAGDTGSRDVLDMFAERPAGAASLKRAAAFNHTPDLASAYVPPAVQPAVPVRPPVPAPPPRVAAPVSRPAAPPPAEPEPRRFVAPACASHLACTGRGNPRRLRRFGRRFARAPVYR